MGTITDLEKSKNCTEKGTSFTEIMLALSLFLLGLIPLIAMYSSNASISFKQGNYLQAMNILDATLNHVISLGYQKLRDEPKTVLKDCMIKTNSGMKSWKVTGSSANNLDASIDGEMKVGNIQYNVKVNLKSIFAGDEDGTGGAKKGSGTTFPFHFQVYTKKDLAFWDTDPKSKGKLFPVVYFKHDDVGINKKPQEVEYHSPEAIIRIIARITWVEKPNVDVAKEIILVTYKTDLER
ncbi:hypothetical protein ACFL35_02925 [Candidatus Riflebacteria bacterium]